MIDEFRFVPESHEYFLGDRRLISVSEALKAGGLADYSHVHPAVLERAAQRGRAVHSATHFLDDGALDVASVSDEIAPYVEAWRQFKADTRAVIVRREEPGYNKLYGYGGTPDLVATIAGVGWVIDLKTYAPNKATGAQLAAYRNLDCMPTDEPMHRAGLWLKPNGKYMLTQFLDESDWQLFLICLDKAKTAQEAKIGH